jgi:hypothetical protein
MNKKILVIGGIAIIIVISFVIYFFIAQNNNVTTTVSNSTGSLPVATSTVATTVIPTSTTLTLGTAEGSVTTTNFYTSSSSSMTADHQTVIIQDQPSYNIEYNVSDSSFVILLLSTPLQTARQAAEAAFLSSLGISQQDACKLNVYEGVPISVSDQYPGENFPLSFCGGPATL